MRFALFLALCIALGACSSSSLDTTQMEAPPWGWTEVIADLPDSFHPLQRTAIAHSMDVRELHFALETNATGTTRSVFVSVYERPSPATRLMRWLRLGDVPGVANPGNGYTYTRIDPASLPLPVGLGDAAAAWRMDNPEYGESGIVVQRCEADLCTEALVGGLAEDNPEHQVHHRDLLQALMIRR